MHRGDLDGVLVKGVYRAWECEAACAALEAGRADLVRSEFPAQFNSSFYGVNLNLADPDLVGYFEEAERFRAGLQRLFPGDLNLERRTAGLMSALDGGRPYEAPPGPSPGQRYMFTTLRWHPAGGYIPPHFDDEQAKRRSYRFLRTLIATKLISFVLAFSQAEAGGELEIYNLASDAGGHGAGKVDPASVESVRITLAPGHMIVFRSGRFLHRLTPVIGRRARWNACSFMAASQDQTRVYCWG
jgi:hypothetical protein